MITHERNVVVCAPTAPLTPDFTITIAVDTAYVASQQGRAIGAGVYMMDNAASNGSGGEGSMELSTVIPVGATLGFSVVPINPLSGDKVAITGFVVSQGSVFGSTGYPQQIQPDWWMAQAQNQGRQTYQIQIQVTVGRIRPVTYYVNWDPFITAR